MNMMNQGQHHDKEVSAHRGKMKSAKKGPKNLSTPNLIMFNFPQGTEKRPSNLHAFNEPKGHWTYPKKGFIQWKKE